jgi:hypothetical protein
MESILEGILAKAKGWRGTIDERFSNIDNVAGLLKIHLKPWAVPNEMYVKIERDRARLQMLVNKCRSPMGSTADRGERNMLLKSATDFCQLEVKAFSYMQYAAGIMTSSDVHELGFLLPGEGRRHHSRSAATNIVAEVKVKVINADVVRVIINQNAENAAKVLHGWPPGVHNALIVITSADGRTEVIRKLTTRMYNDIRMPDGSHGKQFIIEASFLKHIDDEPRFGSEQTFSMPLTTEDLVVASAARPHHEEFEDTLREIAFYRQEIERLEAKLKAKEAGFEDLKIDPAQRSGI